MTIFDVWNYNGEPVANARIEHLSGVVGRFVVVEGRYTFSGRKKDRLFGENASFAGRADVEVVVVDDYVPGGAWANETHQRNAGGEAFRRMAVPGDEAVFSDADEIPGLDFFDAAKNQSGPALWYAQPFFYYNFGRRKKNDWPPHGFLLKYEARQVPTQTGRTFGHKLYVVSGWHASYFDTPAKIADKIKSFSHTEWNIPPYTDEARIRDRILTGRDLFDRDGEDCIQAAVTLLPSSLLAFNEHLVEEQCR